MRVFLLPFLLAAGVATAQEVPPVSGIPLDPSTGAQIGPIFETWMSPHQEGGEEQDTPRLVPDAFKSTTPSVDRNERPSRGHATLAFSRDLSTAYAHIAIEGVNPEDIVMFHIHCGRPGQLGPIIVDFGLENDLTELFADGEASLEITNEDIVAASEHGHGVVAAFVAGCPITLAVPTDKVVTVAGLAHIAYERELYFNLHTSGQTYFGDIRGQLYPVE
ncbi:CHRD domain-containing protein [Octadecabacter sp. G9-8]|uniref:CHRD domain-containing protein n=1 Tax=Octadecabacter dasysiphoniae TaxID=2909341 RepID=A0ABS9CSI7_9RHOB|nr:CHRD domain-containing protein [Octadecabacter dasysiphoniae]MCF2870203.1 CHRD domain-containing protein [Octadecabacter dasysiphoniae]